MSTPYYKELAKLSRLTDEETEVLFDRVKLGDDKAVNQIVEANLRLVVYYAKEYRRLIESTEKLELSDIISEGNLGLIQAVNAYDPAKGTKFSYYASIWIKKQIIECLLYNLHTIRSPGNKLKSDAKIRKKIAVLEQQRFSEIGEQEVRNLGIYDELEIQHYFNKTDVVPISEYFEIPDVTEEEDEPEELRMIRSALKQLKPRERKVIKQYFGIDEQRKTLTKIAEELGIGKERVRQIKEKAIQKIRINWANKKLGLQP